MWAQILGSILRESSHAAIEWLASSPARRALGLARSFVDDTLAYFTERLSPYPLRQAMISILRQAKRRKALSKGWLIGLVLDGTGTARCSRKRCCYCHPVKNKEHVVVGYQHHLSMIGVTGVGLSLPFDIEPYGPGESELTASTRLLQRAVKQLGTRFADYVVADAEYAGAPFLHTVGDLGLYAIVRLKDNLPNLFAAAERRFRKTQPRTFRAGRDRVELWDADDFDPWDALRWETVRIIRYRQHKPDKEIIDAYWLTNMPRGVISGEQLFRMAKSRWEIENQGFNDGKNRYGLEHINHHHPNSLIVQWLIMLLAIMIERLYRLRYLNRGTHHVYTAVEFVRLLRISLGLATVRAHDTS